MQTFRAAIRMTDGRIRRYVPSFATDHTFIRFTRTHACGALGKTGNVQDYFTP